MNALISVDLLRAAGRSEAVPKHWSDEKTRRALDRYEKFLRLAASNPGHAIAPTRDIDTMWHLHMLHPRAYYEDCMRLTGVILDHDGGFGAAPEELPQLKRVFERTADLWNAAYGEPYVQEQDLEPGQTMTNCWHDCQSRCWHACKSGNE